jgi:HPt (histidine-containing phosphotransfer) domain-containing protein
MDKGPIHVTVESDLQDLIPNFMQRRRDDAQKLREALATGDFETVRVIGHSMKGTGGGYGFDGISEFGAAIEKAAKNAANDVARSAVDAFEDYLARVQITFK